MNPKTQKPESRVNLFDQFVDAVLERQSIERQYDITGNTALIPEIDKAREQIRSVMNEMAITA